MAFVYEEPRYLLQSSSSSRKLGPGEYITSSSASSSKYYAPFLSTGKRSKLKINVSTPGPGTYSLQKGNIHSQQGDKQNIFHYSKARTSKSGFLSTMTRFRAKDRQIPGPGSYEQAKDNRKRAKHSESKQNILRLLHDNLERTKSNRVPTIPAKASSSGYTVNMQNELVPIDQSQQKIVPLDPTITEEYKPRAGRAFNYDAATSKLLRFSRMTLDENLVNQKHQRSESQSQSVSLHKPMKRKLRANGDLPPKALKTVLPGPGAYQHQKQVKKDVKTEKFQFFGTSSLRFADSNSQNTQPPLASIFQKSTDYGSGKFKQSFSKSRRDLFNSKFTNDSPGPGDYLSTKFSYNPRKVVTSTSPRFEMYKQQYDEPYEEYSLDTTRVANRILHPARKKRPEISVREIVQNPSPSHYDISTTDIAYQAMKHHRSNAPFGSKGKRFCFQSQRQYDVDYIDQKPSNLENKNHKAFNSGDKRFKYSQREDVGPGKYQFDGNPLLKYSYNIKFHHNQKDL